jgi:hypothetical protein
MYLSPLSSFFRLYLDCCAAGYENIQNGDPGDLIFQKIQSRGGECEQGLDPGHLKKQHPGKERMT